TRRLLKRVVLDARLCDSTRRDRHRATERERIRPDGLQRLGTLTHLLGLLGRLPRLLRGLLHAPDVLAHLSGQDNLHYPVISSHHGLLTPGRPVLLVELRAEVERVHFGVLA